MDIKQQLSLKPTERQHRITNKVAVDIRVAATLDDIATALELIAGQLEVGASKRR